MGLPGCRLAAHYCGLTGYELLSAASLQALVSEQANELAVQDDAPDLLRAFDLCFNTSSRQIREKAWQIAAEYGRRLGILLLTLKRADPINRQARPGWNERQWTFWQGINEFYLGGGLLAGKLGIIAVNSARNELRACGIDSVHISLSAFARYLPILGLARTAPRDTQTMLLLDFGQTGVKRAVALYRSGALIELHILPVLSAGIESQKQIVIDRMNPQISADRIVEMVAQSWSEAQGLGWQLDPVLALSLACYLINGHPPASEMGYYGRLQLLAGNLQTYLRSRISETIGRSVVINLLHDGSAAALILAGLSNSVLLTLGTAIGVGFPPATNDGLREITNDLHLG